MSVLFFKPIPRKALWGKTLVKDYFHYDDFPDGVGQAWAFSGLEQDSSICISEPFHGKTLYELWNTHQELFGHKQGKFPVIVSLVGPEEDLSIQVHPDKEHAKKVGFDAGKNEAWYFLEADKEASIVYGHNAKNQEELQNYIDQEKWYDLIRYLKVKKDDFVYLPAGLLHALKAGSIVYEIQQSTDITYRFFDYHRKDAAGNERELHLQQAIDCLSYDPSLMENKCTPIVKEEEHMIKTVYIHNDSFTVTKLEINGNVLYHDANYQLASVVKGQGKVDGQEVSIGDNFLIPIDTKILFEGQMCIMMTTK